MDKRLTKEQIEAIRQRADKATEGNWFKCHNTDINVEFPPGSCDTASIGYVNCEDDAEFIIHARDDIPDLLAEVEYLRSIITQCRCEECGDELGEDWVDDDGVTCADCSGGDEDDEE